MSYSFHQKALSSVAVFDFDGTLTKRDSLFPFLDSVAGFWLFRWKMLIISPILLGYALKLIPNWWAKQAVLFYFLALKKEKQLDSIAQNFAQSKLPKMLRPEAVECLRWHQQQGHLTLIVSASLEIYLLPFAQMMGFDHVIGTQLSIQNGVLTGRILGKNCYGTEKVRRLEILLGDLKQYYIYAYGDSRGDWELLSIANSSHYRTFLPQK